MVISIHAPTRGATADEIDCRIAMVFQSTLPQGERRRIWIKLEDAKKFQSTLPQGERHRETSHMGQKMNFNPRSHKGSDIIHRGDPNGMY